MYDYLRVRDHVGAEHVQRTKRWKTGCARWRLSASSARRVRLEFESSSKTLLLRVFGVKRQPNAIVYFTLDLSELIWVREMNRQPETVGQQSRS